MLKNLVKLTITLSAVLVVATSPASAQPYPSQTIRIVVPYAPGGFNDTIARVVGKKIQDAWGQPVIVDNRPGGGTLVGLTNAAKSRAMVIR